MREAHGVGHRIQSRRHCDEPVHADGNASAVGQAVGKGCKEIEIQGWYRAPRRAAVALLGLESRALLAGIGQLMITVGQLLTAGERFEACRRGRRSRLDSCKRRLACREVVDKRDAVGIKLWRDHRAQGQVQETVPGPGWWER